MNRALLLGFGATTLAALLVVESCSPNGGSPRLVIRSGTAGASGGTPGALAGAGGDFTFGPFDAAAPNQVTDGGSVCGNGKVEGHETCDDSNTTSGDGCGADCTLDVGWQCPVVGERCVAAKCGDGIVAGTEACDDGNAADGDGCSAACKRELGWACAAGGSGPTACHPTVCGDANKEGFEQCDDGNRIPYDGCSPTCAAEPQCSGGQCTAVCGDGLKFPQEGCDDGNTTTGDGCGADCTIEPGYACDVTTLVAADQLVIPILYRDFLYAGTTTPGPGHPDFEFYTAGATGLVQSNLGADGRPVFASSTGNGTAISITDATSFYWWYHETKCDGTNCVPNPYEKLVFLDAANNPTTLTLGRLPSGSYQFDSSAFFPVNGLGWGTAQTFFGLNFSFTSELRYVFTYQGGEVFDFRGDDDVYVFINGKLAVDLGGLHGPESGSVTLDAGMATSLGLSVGGMYEICVFQAERHTTGSNYQLTLSGFVHATSTCHSICGDKIVTADEVCDDGVNDGRYNGCMPGCQARGPYCGDGKIQSGEICDDGNTRNGDSCLANCTLPNFH